MSGSILALILLAGKPLLKNRISKAFAYYIWLLVLMRLVVPLSTPVNIMNALFHSEQPGAVDVLPDQTDSQTAGNMVGTVGQSAVITDTQRASSQEQQSTEGQTTANVKLPFHLWDFIQSNLLWLWLAGAAVSIGWFSIAYTVFSRSIRRSCTAPHCDDLLVFEHLRGRLRVRLVCSSHVTTPMTIGILRPVIVLPQLAYVRDGMEYELENILHHELNHCRRKDLLYKWLVIAVTSLHWFNPLMLWIRKEISRACELACDEAVISRMSESERQLYGNTLLTFSAGRKLPAGILATTLCEGKEQLKERLISIMKYKKKSTWAVALTLILALFLTGCAVALGTANGSNAEATSGNSTGILADLTEWLSENTDIPIYLPNAWQPVMSSTTQNYYFEMSGDADYYSFNVYQTDVPVKFNNENDLLAENGPVSESDYVGSISGKVITEETPSLSVEIPADAESYEIVSGVTGYDSEGQTIWQENGWSFEWIRGTDVKTNDTIEALVNAWLNADTLIAETGQVKVVEGNRFTVYYDWDKAGCRYEFVTVSTDFEETIKILNNFIKVDESAYDVSPSADAAVTSVEGTGPFVGYVQDATTDTFDVYTEEGGTYIMSLPYSVDEQFPATDRTYENWEPGWMNADIYCGTIDDFTWAVVSTGPSAGSGHANVCTSTDGGKTWWVGDKSAMHGGTVTGAGFASEEVGFMSYRYYSLDEPEISRTLDGGKTWELMTVDVPDYLKEYTFTPLSPTFTGDSGSYPIELFSDAQFIGIAYLITEDGGMTWQWQEKISKY